MDGTTEPMIAVIGHPIAGNPSQLAIERALESLGLDWRVLSFDVRPEDVGLALDGFRVIGIAGVLVDRSVQTFAATWLDARKSLSENVSQASAENQESSDHSSAILPIDCLHRDEQGDFVGTFGQRAFADQLIRQHLATIESAGAPTSPAADQPTAAAGDVATPDSQTAASVSDESARLWIGDRDPWWPVDAREFPDRGEFWPPDAEMIADARVIVIAASEPIPLDSADWPADDGSTLVIDLTDGHPEIDTLVRLGYRCVTAHQRAVGNLVTCVRTWTGQSPPEDVISEAIEEYTGV